MLGACIKICFVIKLNPIHIFHPLGMNRYYFLMATMRRKDSVPHFQVFHLTKSERSSNDLSRSYRFPRASTASIQRICVLVSYLGRLQLFWEKMGNLTEGYCFGHISIRRTIGSLSSPLIT